MEIRTKKKRNRGLQNYLFTEHFFFHRYEFRILDFRWNFRHALFHENDRRTLIKAYGLRLDANQVYVVTSKKKNAFLKKCRFVVTVDGIAGKFSLRNTVLNVGNGLALLGEVFFPLTSVSFLY